jgi:AcrR family transcriptional regulator
MYWQHWDELVARHAGDPRAQLRAIFGHLAARTTQPRYRGCPFLNCAIEFPDPASPGHRVAVAVKRQVVRRLARLAEAIGARSPTELADGLVLLIEGSYAISQTLGGRASPAHAVARAADALIDAQIAS